MNSRGNAEVRRVGAHLVGLGARERRQAHSVVETETLVELGRDPRLRAVPQARPEIKSEIRSLAAAIGGEAVGPAVGRTEVVRILLDVRRLPVDREALLGRRARRGCLRRGARIVDGLGARRSACPRPRRPR